MVAGKDLCRRLLESAIAPADEKKLRAAHVGRRKCDAIAALSELFCPLGS
jgi:hypothetical protein